jgi:hypothetical protein
MSYQSNLPAMKARVTRAVDAGLIAAADHAIEVMKLKLGSNYYTGGQYATGHLLQHIFRTEPFTNSQGHRAILYGVDNEALYALFWELGFYKWPSFYSESKKQWITVTRFPLKWYRVELWVPTFLELQPRFKEIFLANARPIMMGS